jgi:hypothetical protein
VKQGHVIEERKGMTFSIIFGGSYNVDSNIVCCVEMVGVFEVICLLMFILYQEDR